MTKFIRCEICHNIYSEKRTHCPVCGCRDATTCIIRELNSTGSEFIRVSVAAGAERASQNPRREPNKITKLGLDRKAR